MVFNVKQTSEKFKKKYFCSANQQHRASCWDSNAIIYATGKVIWVPPCQVTTYCNLTLDRDPLGEQKCDLKFGSWTFDGNTIDLQFFDDVIQQSTIICLIAYKTLRILNFSETIR